MGSLSTLFSAKPPRSKMGSYATLNPARGVPGSDTTYLYVRDNELCAVTWDRFGEVYTTTAEDIL